MSQNGQTHFKSRTAFAAKFCKCVWPFWKAVNWRVKVYKKTLQISSKQNLRNLNERNVGKWKYEWNLKSKLLHLLLVSECFFSVPTCDYGRSPCNWQAIVLTLPVFNHPLSNEGHKLSFIRYLCAEILCFSSLSTFII